MKLSMNVLNRHRIATVVAGAFVLGAAIALSGCDPTIEADAQEAFTSLCAAAPALEPIESQLNFLDQNDLKQVLAACTSGGVSNAAEFGFDLVALYDAVEPYLANAKLTAKESAAVRKLRALAVKHHL